MRIEYASELLDEAARLENGFLYGLRDGATLRLTGAQDSHSAPAGLLGTFARRKRGEVFMTESDLLRLEAYGGSVALLMVGSRAGFFVYEPDGSIQTVQSYQEFPLPVRRVPPKPRRAWARPALVGALAFVMMMIPIRAAPGIELSIREDAGQLRISWNARAFKEARLEISDGAERNWIPVRRGLTSATYVPATGDVSVRLTGNQRTASAHFVRIAQEDAGLAQLEQQAASLRAALEDKRRRAAVLERKLATLK